MSDITLCLSGFRCYDEERMFNFTSDEIIRIRGDSGIGKTTIFTAIQWVLYNYPTSNIYPRHGKTKKTCVKLSLPWQNGTLVIERSKNPGLLKLTLPDGQYQEDDVAQATIENLFGSRDVWRVCCYLPQVENCPLLSYSNTQRMDILESLSFLNEKPDQDLNRITEEIQRLQGNFNEAQKEFYQLEERMSPLQGAVEDFVLEPETYKQTLLRQQKIEAEIKSLEEQYVLADEHQKQKKTLEERLKKAKEGIDKLETVNVEEIKDFEQEISDLQEELSFSQQVEAKERLENKKKDIREKLQILPIPEREYTQEEYQEIFSLEKKIKEEVRIAAQWKISYSQEQVVARINHVKVLLDAQKDAQVWLRIKTLQKKLELLNGPDVSIEDLEKAREELKTLERSLDVHKCPSCKRSLRYLRDHLVLSETSPVSPDKITKFREALLGMEAAYRESYDRKMLSLQLDSLLSTVSGQEPIDKVLKAPEIKKLEQEVTELSRLAFPEKAKITSREIQLSRDYYTLQNELISVEEELSYYPETDRSIRSHNVIMSRLKKCQQRLHSLKDIIPRRDMLDKQIKTILCDIEMLPSSVIEDIAKELDSLRQSEEEIRIAFEDDQLARDYIALEEKYSEQQEKVNSINIELAAALRLKDLGNREICEILEERIGTINQSLSEICNKIFSDPITVELAMIKTTKTSKITKPCVHLRIWYRDGEFDSISDISFGEGKRISLAVSLALSQLNNFPLLLLDESLYGLHDELKETTLEVARELSNGKTVLVIMHEGITGVYDSILDLNGVVNNT